MKAETGLHFPAGKLKRIIVLGAAPRLVALSDFCTQHNLELEIYTGDRHRDIKLSSGYRLFDELEKRGRLARFCDQLETTEKGPYSTANKESLIISFGSPFIIKQSLIDLYQGRVINSHGAPLPEFRGGGGLTWRFLAGDTRGMVLFHKVTKIIDDGGIIYKKGFEFPWPAKTISEWLIVDEKEQELGLLDFLSRLMTGEKFIEEVQDQSRVTYFPRLNTDTHAFLDFRWSGEMISRFVGAFSGPYSGASTFVGDFRVRIYSAEFLADTALRHPFLFGLVIRIFSGHYWILCRDGILKVPEASLMPIGAVKVGDRLYTPSNLLDDALSKRVVYTPKGLK
jgi:methionyl-tRNA formyltransferase